MVRLTLALAALAALWFAAIAMGSLGNGDTSLRFQLTHAWLTGQPEIIQDLPPPTSRRNIQHGVVGANGVRRDFYDPGQSLLMAPADWLSPKVHRLVRTRDSKGLRVWTVTLFAFLPLTVALVLTCFWTLRLLGFEARLAALTALLWFVGTTVLPYAQNPFQNNQVLLLTMLAYALALAGCRRGSLAFIVLSGAAAGFALLVRTSAVLHVFTAGLFLLAVLRLQAVHKRRAVEIIACWIASILPFAIGGRIFDAIRYGSPWVTGQSVWLAQIKSDPIFAGLPPVPAGFPLINPASVGIFGVLFSPAKSIFLYDPLLLPCVFAAVLAWRRLSGVVRVYALLALLNLALHIALTSKLDFWHGDYAWGARYHVSSVELLLVCLLPLIVQPALYGRPAIAWALRGLLALGVGVQLLAVSMPMDLEISRELLQTEPVRCDREWDTVLGFRLGDRLQDLYCLASSSSAPWCPSVVAERAKQTHPECLHEVGDLEFSNRPAFFPFDSTHRLIGYRPALMLWSALFGSAVLWTLAWFVSAARRRPVPRSASALGGAVSTSTAA